MAGMTTQHAAFGLMDLTFVFPCLNEEETLAQCIRDVRASLDRAEGLAYEIVVADNGSEDRSAEIAMAEGARVVPVSQRGYGAALQGGIEAAEGTYVMFADADQTYRYEDALALYEKAIEADADMAIASRMTDAIEPGAMPGLHRHLGTPVLTWLINRLFHGRLSDCNSGFRCLRKTAYQRWAIRSNGMEFASELLIKALKGKAKIVEIPSGLRRGPEGREAHLRTWRDGMRHLLFILSERPQLFEFIGLFLALVASLMQLLAFVTGPIAVVGLNIFDVHSKVLLLITALVGAQLYLFSCVLYLRGKHRCLGITRMLITLDEGVLFFATLLAFGVGMLGVAALFVAWMRAGFGGIHLMDILTFGGHFLSVFSVLVTGLLCIHVYKKSEKGLHP